MSVAAGIVTGLGALPPKCINFSSPEFLRLFIFDGEFADELFDPKKAEADRAIDALCQLYLLGEVSQFRRRGVGKGARKLAAPRLTAACNAISTSKLR